MNSTEGTKAVEAIVLEYPPEQLFLQKALKNMNKLRMLHRIRIDFSIIDDEAPLIKDGSIEYLPNSLRCFIWEGYPWESLPANFEPKRLIHLKLWKSSLCHLWVETKDMRCLRRLDLSWSSRLKQTPDFTRMPNLEYVDLAFCKSLEEVHFGNCNKLVHLCLNGCGSLERFPRVNVESLEFLDLRGCNSLEKFPEIIGRMKPEFDIFEYIRGTWIRELPSSIQYQTHLTKLDLNTYYKYSKLDIWIESLLYEIGYLVNLEWLDVSNTLISKPPPSIVLLNKLKFLSFAKCQVAYKENFVFPLVAEGLQSLEELDLSYCNLIEGGLPKDIGRLSSLKKLILTGNRFVHLPQSIGQLGSLRCLDLSRCWRLKELPDFTGMLNLEICVLSGCTDLEEVHHSLGYLKELTKLSLSHCHSLKRFPAPCIDSLKNLDLKRCSSLENFPEILGSMKLELEIHMVDNVMRSCLHSIKELRQNICSNSLLQRVFSIDFEDYEEEIPRWFNHHAVDDSINQVA